MVSDSPKVLERLAQNEKRRADKYQSDLEKAESTFSERISNLEKNSLKEKSLENDEERDLPAFPRFLCKLCKLSGDSILSGLFYIAILAVTEIGVFGNKEED